MTILFFGLGIVAFLISIISIFLFPKVGFSWLSKISDYLVLSLPFEYFPRVEIAGASFRISQFLVLIGFWILILLIIKKDSQVMSHKIHFVSYSFLIFLFLSFPSFLFVADWTRFVVHWFGTILVFGAMIFLANFATNIWKALQKLAIILFGCSVFGLYQFFGDLVGIPSTFTLLREHYTKVVFGVPRIQGTAVEPLYFAGMLMIAIFVLMLWICLRIEDKYIVKTGQNSLINNTSRIKIKHLFLGFGVVFVVFLLTISKGTFGVLGILCLALMPVLYFMFSFIRNFINKYIFQSILFLILGSGLFFSFINPIQLLGEVGTNFIETIAGTSASARERSLFVTEAITGIKQNPILGIGMGQYGDYVSNNLGSLNEDGKAIVNNVYLEIWLEEGILALFFFVFMLLQPIFILLNNLKSNLYSQKSIAGIVLVFALVGYYIQWTLFSPIFIMPIFILLGLAYKLYSKSNYEQNQ